MNNQPSRSLGYDNISSGAESSLKHLRRCSNVNAWSRRDAQLNRLKCNITKSFQKFIEILTALHFPGAGEVGRHFELRIVLLCLLLWSLSALVLLFYSLCDRPLPFCLMFSLTLSLPSRLNRLSLRLSPAHWQCCRLTVQTAASSNLFQHQPQNHPLMSPSHPSAVVGVPVVSVQDASPYSRPNVSSDP